jgi:hypothetical protein
MPYAVYCSHQLWLRQIYRDPDSIAIKVLKIPPWDIGHSQTGKFETCGASTRTLKRSSIDTISSLEGQTSKIVSQVSGRLHRTIQNSKSVHESHELSVIPPTFLASIGAEDIQLRFEPFRSHLQIFLRGSQSHQTEIHGQRGHHSVHVSSVPQP